MSQQVQTETERINASWIALEKVIKTFTDEQLTNLKKDRWTIKDHLAHIALGEQYAVAVFGGQTPHGLFGTDQATLLSSSDDELNELGYQRTRSLSLSQVMELRQTSHQQLLDTVAGLTDDDLHKPFAPYGEPLGPTMLDTLHGNTYEHYDTHRGWIEAYAINPESSTQ